MRDHTESSDHADHIIHAQRPIGISPGTLIVDDDAAPPVITVWGYGPDALEEHAVPDVAGVRALRGRWPVLWVNVDGLGSAKTIAALGDLFGLHRLALEDVANLHQRPKIEEYPSSLFIVIRMPELVERFTTEQVSIFLGQDFVVTFQEHPGDCLDPVRQRIRTGRGLIRKSGPDYLTYAILDAVVDSYFPVLEAYGERLEELEDDIAHTPTTKTIRRIQQAKRDLLVMRRSIWPQRELLNSLLRDEVPFVNDSTRIYLRDAYDHAVRIMDLLETYRELGSGLTDFYMSSVSNRMNEVMKVLTVIATIFIPLTFVAGLYGMNFNADVSPFNLPELNWYLGYPFALLLMVVLAGILVLFFRRKGWIGSPERDRDTDDDR